MSLLTAARHPDVAMALAMWWVSGGPYGLVSLGVHYCGNSLATAWREGMNDVAELPEWNEVISRNSGNHQRFIDQDRNHFIATMENWLLAYCPVEGELIPDLPDTQARALTVPTLIFRSGESDVHHTRATTEKLAALIPGSRLVEPPWGDREWIERGVSASQGGSLFERWHLLTAQLTAWAAEVAQG